MEQNYRYVDDLHEGSGVLYNIEKFGLVLGICNCSQLSLTLAQRSAGVAPLPHNIIADASNFKYRGRWKAKTGRRVEVREAAMWAGNYSGHHCNEQGPRLTVRDEGKLRRN